MGIKYAVNEAFFDVWNLRMAYVLGYIYADGNIGNWPKMRARYVSITSTDRDSIERMRSWMHSRHTIVMRESQWENGKDAYTLRIGNHKLYESLVTFGLHPRKSLTITFPDIPQQHLKDFVRGYFDGDGCVNIYRVKNEDGTGRLRKLSVIFTSGSKVFLEQLAFALTAAYQTKPQNIVHGKTAFQLRYSTKDALILFRELYKGCEKGEYLERKHRIFSEWIDTKRPRGEVVNTAVCKTAIRGFNSRRGLT